MNEREKLIVRLAEKHKEPDEFIRRVERLSGASQLEKGDLFLEVGNILNKHYYPDLAVSSWCHACRNFIKDGDEAGVEETILKLAKTIKEPDEFIRKLEKLSRVSSIEKADFFLAVGAVLHKFSSFALAKDSWNHALKYVTHDDKMNKSRCCCNLGVAYCSLGAAEDVAGLFDTKPFNGSTATKENVRENCAEKDVIHFSCHGHFNIRDPLTSGVELYDGILTSREIFDMKFNVELVALSACETGLNERSLGDELIGLTRAFIYAGAPSVIVSLWSVDARSTQELMLEFYRLLKSGKDKATALQEAQKKIMENKEWSHPYYWAPFILVGDWQ